MCAFSARHPVQRECHGGQRARTERVNKVIIGARQNVSGGGGVALAVSLDIANAFNSFPWLKIKRALIRHKIPIYLRNIVDSYLENRTIIYNIGKYVPLEKRRTERGIPQGFVLGPLLWNLGFDPVIRAAVPDRVVVVCYADDTLVLVTGRSWTRRPLPER